MFSAAYVWARVIRQLEDRLSAVTVSALFDDAEPVELNDKNYILYTPSDFRQETILRSCKQLVEQILQEEFHLRLELLVWSNAEMEKRQPGDTPESLWKINPHFSFASFVPGTANIIPLKAAIHVAEHVGDSNYNPLYLYGNPGVGKTHLLYSIANRISQTDPGARIVYVKGDQFTNELIQSIMNASTMMFKKKYREADILLVDDIQFIQGKKSSQEEFFHTFNGLFEQHKQIVMTSDRPPSDMPLLDDRLKSRFGEGIMLKIEAPDLETRQQIIAAKAAALGLPLGEETIRFLSEKLCGDVRQLEGTLRKIRAFRELSGMTLTLSNVAQTVADIQTSQSCATVTPDTVVRYVCKYFGLEEAQLKGPHKSRNVSEPRQIAMYLVRSMTGLGPSDIGKFFRRDHGTVHHALKKIDDQLTRKDGNTEEIIRDIRMNIEAST